MDADLATRPVPECPVCATPGGPVVHDGLTDRAFGVAPGSWTLRGCGGCGAARLDPRPDDDAIAGLYASYYTHDAPVTNLSPGGLAGLLRSLRNDHVNATLGYDLRPAHRAGRALARLVPPLAGIAERGVRSLPRGDRLLDVGCGNGLFVAEAAAAGWHAAGIDLDPVAVEAGRGAGLDLRVATVAEAAEATPGAFDAVTLSHVIEHLADPVGVLRDVHRLLRPGGRVWIATPNLAAAGHRRYGADWLHLDPPRHLVLFDAPSLARALTAAGFGRVQVLRPTPTALPVFTRSAAVRAGTVPANDATDAAPATTLAAARASLSAVRDRRRAEELMVIAHAA